jgi:UDP-N-acetyl-D-mannosaminuronate dehydrogenase
LNLEKILVIGLGEVGRPLYEILKKCNKFQVYGFDIDEKKVKEIEQSEIPQEVDIIHICIPCFSQHEFINAVVNYVKKFKPKLLIINSTVPPGTTQEIHKQCDSLVVHSPVRGVHKNFEHMMWELKRWKKYIGGTDEKSGKLASKHFEAAGFKTEVLKSCIETELAKLFETTYRAWMIACFQEMHRISKHFNADFDQVVDFLEDTHRVRFDRPVMFPDVIGGHCLIPNCKLLLEKYESDFLRLILESNEKRKKEILKKDIKDEVEKIKKRVKKLENNLAK